MGAPPPIDDAVLDDLSRRLTMTRAPRLPAGLGWQRGTDSDYLAELVDHWARRRVPDRDRGRRWRRTEGAYASEQATKPHTLAAALADSPAGLAAWIVEKLRSWSDCGGDVESVFPRDDLLTWVTAYWVTGTIGTSFSPYVERREQIERVNVPTAVTRPPHDQHVTDLQGFAA